MQVGKHTEATRKLKSKEKSNEKEITTLRDKVWSFMCIFLFPFLQSMVCSLIYKHTPDWN